MKHTYKKSALTCLVTLAVAGLASTAAMNVGAQAAAKDTSSPAALLGGLQRWHLTLPTSKDKQAYPADQIDNPELATYSSKYFKLNDDKTAVVFTSIVGGATTTTGTAFARTELREYDEKGEKAAWDCMTAERKLTIRQRIVKVPLGKPEMSVGQIHDAKSDNVEILYWGPNKSNGTTDKGRLIAKMNGESKSVAGMLDPAYALGDIMVVSITTKDGKMTVDYKNETTGATGSSTKPFEKVTGGCYFKVGNYHQSCAKENIYGVTNPNCSKKKYKDEQWEKDPNAESIVEVFSLKLD